MEYDKEVTVTLGGCEVSLVPSLDAAKGLAKKYGAYLPMLDLLNLGHLEMATDVFFFALGKKDSKRDELQEQVFTAGLTYLTPHLVRFVIGLMNGGKIQPAKKATDA